MYKRQTLLTPEDGVPFVNQVTMRLFCALGGHFTVATGRTMESAGRHLDLSLIHIFLSGGDAFVIVIMYKK